MRRNKIKRFRSMKGVAQQLLLLSPEPWLGMRDAELRDPDKYYCCSGYECGCGGLKVREWWNALELPAIDFIRVESRSVNPWSLITEKK